MTPDRIAAPAEHAIRYEQIAVKVFGEVVQVRCECCDGVLYLPTFEYEWECPYCDNVVYRVGCYDGRFLIRAKEEGDAHFHIIGYAG